MFGRAFPLFKVFGIQVQADLSWLIIVALVIWSLAAGVFPAQYKDLPTAAYWVMGAAAAIGLFGDQLVGVVSLRDLMEFITLKFELDDVGIQARQQPRTQRVGEVRAGTSHSRTPGAGEKQEMHP